MRHWKGALISIIAVLVVVVAASSAMVASPQETTMIQAYQIALKTAHEWDPNARLYHMISVDIEGKTDSLQGALGTRAKWNVEFVDPDTGRQLGVYVTNGVAGQPREAKNPTVWPGTTQFPTIDLKRAIQVATDSGVTPSQSMFFGYHYRLVYNEESKQLELWLYGRNGEGTPKTLRFQPESTVLINA
ncbi:MAG TPA: hypothetical protein VK191_03930 [Symbiobacteriaceae bacterium]|nr:hypothetical protein [Symbiobacteriaceae bacterium]